MDADCGGFKNMPASSLTHLHSRAQHLVSFPLNTAQTQGLSSNEQYAEWWNWCYLTSRFRHRKDRFRFHQLSEFASSLGSHLRGEEVSQGAWGGAHMWKGILLLDMWAHHLETDPPTPDKPSVIPAHRDKPSTMLSRTVGPQKGGENKHSVCFKAQGQVVWYWDVESDREMDLPSLLIGGLVCWFCLAGLGKGLGSTEDSFVGKMVFKLWRTCFWLYNHRRAFPRTGKS